MHVAVSINWPSLQYTFRFVNSMLYVIYEENYILIYLIHWIECITLTLLRI